MPENNQLDINETFESQKRLVMTSIIPALLKVLDPEMYLIGEELNSILMKSVYHNPEVSEDDEELNMGDHCILYTFLRGYLNAIFYQQRLDRRKYMQIYDNNNFAADEIKALINTSQWTKLGYMGLMKAIIEKATSKYDNRNELDVLNSHINFHKTPKPPEP
ncbi:263_t:CDS:2 [Funneliformis caledonium]|uniref:263_t:CDS:1 n=1 Tax=Funneliformis caledonium TaxID=1117310 RepID=A0A9N9GN05_9GLOM|nr:263_t:CDS:2 [Funneliformis caledonium]